MTIFIGHETQTLFLPTKINEKKSLRSADLTIIILSKYYKHSQTTTQAVYPKCALFFASLLRVDLSEQPVSGAAQRQRQRRLRSWLRHDRRNGPGREYAPFLTRTEECQGQGVGARDELHGHGPGPPFPPSPPSPPPPSSHTPAGALPPPAKKSPSGRGWTGSLPCPRRRSGICGALCEQIVDAVPSVPVLDDPAPQTVEQLQDIMRIFETLLPVPEKVIEVPKILLDDVLMRIVVRDMELGEQSVEVPTTTSFSSLQRIVEQNVGIPVPGGGGRFAGLQGFPPSTAPQFSEGFWWRSSRLSPRTEFASASASFSPPAGIHEDGNEPGVGFFTLFTEIKKVRRPQPPPSERVHASVSSSTPALQLRLLDWILLFTVEAPYNGDRTGETRWVMEDGYLPFWWLRPGGRCERLREGEVFEMIDDL